MRTFLGNACLITKCLFTIFVPLNPPPSQPAKWWISSSISIKKTSKQNCEHSPKNSNKPSENCEQNYEQMCVSELLIAKQTLSNPLELNHSSFLWEPKHVLFRCTKPQGWSALATSNSFAARSGHYVLWLAQARITSLYSEYIQRTTRATICRSLWALQAQIRKKVSKRVLLALCKKVTEKYPKKSKNTWIFNFAGMFFYLFSGNFGDFFADPQKDSVWDVFLRTWAWRARRIL